MNKKILFFCAIFFLAIMLVIGIKYQDKIEYISKKYNKVETKITENTQLYNLDNNQKVGMFNELQSNLQVIAKKVFENINMPEELEYVNLNIKDYYYSEIKREYTYEAYTNNYKITFYERSKDIKIEKRNISVIEYNIDNNEALRIAENLINEFEFLNDYNFKELIGKKELCYEAIYYTEKRDKNNNVKPPICTVLFDAKEKDVIQAIFTYENANELAESTEKIGEAKAIQIAKEEAKKVEYTDFYDNYTIIESIVTPNNFFTRKKDETEIYGNTDKEAYIVTLYSETKSGLMVFVDVKTGEVLGGKRK